MNQILRPRISEQTLFIRKFAYYGNLLISRAIVGSKFRVFFKFFFPSPLDHSLTCLFVTLTDCDLLWEYEGN